VLLAGTVSVARAQGTISGDVVTRNGQPLPYASIIVDPGGRARFADAGGSFTIRQLALGTYHVRARQIGYAPADTTVVLSTATPTAHLRFRLNIVALLLPADTIVATRTDRCIAPGIPDSTVNPVLAQVFAEIEKNVGQYRVLIEEYPFDFTREEWRVVRNGAGYEQTIQLDTLRYQVQKMESRPYQAGHVVVWDVGPRGDSRQYMPLPTFGYLGDSTFQRAHCFQYMGVDTSGGTPSIRVDFRPSASIRTPDLEGSVFLDGFRYVVRRAVFRLTEPGRVVPPISQLSVTTTFREIVPLVPIFDEVRYIQPTYKSGLEATMEVDRLLRVEFAHGAPGERR
jgi:hypothetical protein